MLLNVSAALQYHKENGTFGNIALYPQLLVGYEDPAIASQSHHGV
jgi:hypothetical protein